MVYIYRRRLGTLGGGGGEGGAQRDGRVRGRRRARRRPPMSTPPRRRGLFAAAGRALLRDERAEVGRRRAPRAAQCRISGSRRQHLKKLVRASRQKLPAWRRVAGTREVASRAARLQQAMLLLQARRHAREHLGEQALSRSQRSDAPSLLRPPSPPPPDELVVGGVERRRCGWSSSRIRAKRSR